FMTTSLAVLRTGGDDLAVGQVNLANQSRTRTVAGTARFHGHRLAHGVLEIGLSHVARAEEAGRGPFVRPGLDLPLFVLHVHEQVDVRVAPVDLRQRAGAGEALVEI